MHNDNSYIIPNLFSAKLCEGKPFKCKLFKNSVETVNGHCLLTLNSNLNDEIVLIFIIVLSLSVRFYKTIATSCR